MTNETNGSKYQRTIVGNIFPPKVLLAHNLSENVRTCGAEKLELGETEKSDFLVGTLFLDSSHSPPNEKTVTYETCWELCVIQKAGWHQHLRSLAINSGGPFVCQGECSFFLSVGTLELFLLSPLRLFSKKN